MNGDRFVSRLKCKMRPARPKVERGARFDRIYSILSSFKSSFKRCLYTTGDSLRGEGGKVNFYNSVITGDIIDLTFQFVFQIFFVLWLVEFAESFRA